MTALELPRPRQRPAPRLDLQPNLPTGQVLVDPGVDEGSDSGLEVRPDPVDLAHPGGQFLVDPGRGGLRRTPSAATHPLDLRRVPRAMLARAGVVVLARSFLSTRQRNPWTPPSSTVVVLGVARTSDGAGGPAAKDPVAVEHDLATAVENRAVGLGGGRNPGTVDRHRRATDHHLLPPGTKAVCVLELETGHAAQAG